MRRSTDRILTTHTGSLPRPADLVPLIFAAERGEEVDRTALDAQITRAVYDVVRTQIANGIDVVDDGEQSKSSYVGYAKNRLTGFGGEGALGMAGDLAEFPEFVQRARGAGTNLKRPACNGPVSYKSLAEVETDIANFRAALAGVSPAETFMTAAAPGVIAVFLPNQYYPTHEAYIWALAEAMKTEYDAIHRAGFLLQIDCPDLALGRHVQFPHLSLEEWRTIAATNVEALNWATRDIPAESLRMHLCWGNYEGPHHKDVALRDIADLVLSARPNAISLEASNPRHEHEWAVWQDIRLPDEKILIPGVIDSTCNFVEHPELIAQRLERYAEVIGRERVMAGTDCGMATGAGSTTVDPAIAWLKLGAMAEGARLASARLWVN